MKKLLRVLEYFLGRLFIIFVCEFKVLDRLVMPAITALVVGLLAIYLVYGSSGGSGPR